MFLINLNLCSLHLKFQLIIFYIAAFFYFIKNWKETTQHIHICPT